jgi:hypothetical protein
MKTLPHFSQKSLPSGKQKFSYEWEILNSKILQKMNKIGW